MKPRIDYLKADPDSLKAMLALQGHVDQSGIDPKVFDLIKVRASQMNGCAYCIDMHTKDARSHGETEQRLYELNAWRETPFYDARERAALAWTEAVTAVAETHVPDDVYAEVREHFDEQALVRLTMAIVAINGWNRLCVSFRVVPGAYRPATSQGARSL